MSAKHTLNSIAALLIAIVLASASCRESVVQKYSRTLGEFRIYSDVLRESMHQASGNDHLHGFANTTGDTAPYSWRMVLLLDRTCWDIGVVLDREKSWRSEHYSVVVKELRRRVFCVPSQREDEGNCGLFAVVGQGSAYNAMTSGEEVEVLGDSILLMDADLGDVNWMSPVDIDGSAILKDPNKLPSPATADGRFVGFVDGVAYFLDKTVPPELIAKFIPAGKEASDRDREREFGPYLLDKRLPNPPAAIDGSKITILNE